MFAPVYNKVADRIKEDIQSRRWTDKLPGVGVLARRYEVAPRTITKAVGVLADQGLVTPHGTRGTFITQTAAKRPHYGKLGVVGLYPQMHSQTAMIEAEKTANRLGYQLMLLGLPNGLDQATACLHQMPVDGLIFANATLNKKVAVNLRQQNIPFVSLNRMDDIPGTPWIDFDNEQGLELALQQLIELGHRRIAYMAFRYHLDAHQRRAKEVYRHILEKKTDCFDPALWFGEGKLEDYAQNSGWEQAARAYGRQMMKNLLEVSNLPTAIYIGNSNMALGAHQFLQEAGDEIQNSFVICAKARNKKESDESPFFHIASDSTALMCRAVEILIDLTIRPAEKPIREFVPYQWVQPQMAETGVGSPALALV